MDDVGCLQEVKEAGSEADHAPPSSAGVKNKWSGTSVHLHTLKACVGTTVIFRRFRKIAKSDYELRHVRSPVCPHGTTRLPLDGFS